VMSFSVRGVRDLDMRLRLIVARLRSELPEVMQGIAQGIAADARGRIGSYQEGWPKLAASTVKEKTRRGYSPPDKPLLRTGVMRRSIHGEGDALVAIVRADAPAKWQERGTRNKHVPARPFLKPAMRAAVPEAKRLLTETFETAVRES